MAISSIPPAVRSTSGVHQNISQKHLTKKIALVTSIAFPIFLAVVYLYHRSFQSIPKVNDISKNSKISSQHDSSPLFPSQPSINPLLLKKETTCEPNVLKLPPIQPIFIPEIIVRNNTIKTENAPTKNNAIKESTLPWLAALLMGSALTIPIYQIKNKINLRKYQEQSKTLLDVNKEYEALKIQFSELTKVHAELLKRISDTENAGTEGTNKESAAKLSEVDKSNSNSIVELSDDTKVDKDSDTKLLVTEKLNRELKIKLSELEALNKALEAKLSVVEELNSRLKAELSDGKKVNKESMKPVQKLENEILTATENPTSPIITLDENELSKKETEILLLKGRIRELETLNKRVSRKLDKKIIGVQNLAESKKLSAEKSIKQLAAKQKEIRESKKEIKMLNFRIVALNLKIESMERLLTRFKKEIIELIGFKELNLKLKTHIEKLKFELSNTEKKSDEIKDNYQQLNESRMVEFEELKLIFNETKKILESNIEKLNLEKKDFEVQLNKLALEQGERFEQELKQEEEINNLIMELQIQKEINKKFEKELANSEKLKIEVIDLKEKLKELEIIKIKNIQLEKRILKYKEHMLKNKEYFKNKSKLEVENSGFTSNKAPSPNVSWRN